MYTIHIVILTNIIIRSLFKSMRMCRAEQVVGVGKKESTIFL